ncbi:MULTISPECIES: peptide synthetase [Pandoraea]|uniref:peptide synthetase n=1 Tax=Pandoraea TaxID=93217 RepID=UPI001F5D8A36|nr:MULTISPECIES: peptide synthetase [Pandoraea]MCI3205992.1 peptide synthetase [Pandoraea sp. LA3]MDN4584020.1 peptide synthetase [Pandoraea capi]
MDIVQGLPPLFDFAPYLEVRDETLPLIREFASHMAFRSAVVEELELDEDFYRRPLRPEDLEFLQFKKAVRAETVSRLPMLASQRLLMCINEVGIARMPRPGDAEGFASADAFYSERNQVLGARIRPYLENYAYTFLGNEGKADTTPASLTEALRAIVQTEHAWWSEMFALLQRNEYLPEGLRFIMIQRWSLAPSRRAAVARAVASGYFDAVSPDARPVMVDAAQDALLTRVAGALDLTRREHSYWQFYLPTSLAKCNLLYALGARPDRAFALLGAAFVAEAEMLAFCQAAAAACPHMLHGLPIQQPTLEDAVADLLRRASAATAQIDDKYAQQGLYRVSQGLGAAELMAARGRWDLGEQLRWLSAIERYVAFAKQVEGRIEVECPGIDRETFVEPREMCSTTHVHNDHRLVVIESGDMIFWGNLGMQLKMKQGDSVLIPDGRLHGSTVVSHECTYHQPIIPDEWIAALHAGTMPAPQSSAALA